MINVYQSSSTFINLYQLFNCLRFTQRKHPRDIKSETNAAQQPVFVVFEKPVLLGLGDEALVGHVLRIGEMQRKHVATGLDLPAQGEGIGIGLVVSVFFILRSNYKRAYFYHKEKQGEEERIRIELAEDVTFLNKGAIALTLDQLPDNSTVLIDGTKSHHIDLDVLEIIHNFKSNVELKNIKLELKNIPDFKGTSGH